MESNEQDEVFTDDVEDTSESVEETAEESVEKTEKPKRTPQEEYEYHLGRAKRIAKKLGLDAEDKPEARKDSSKPTDDLDYGEKAYLRSALNLKGADELQLAREFKQKYRMTAEELESDQVFLGRLTKLRETREATDALPKGKNRSAQTAVTDVDYAYSKFKETGELPTDFKMKTAVIDRITAEEKGPSFNF